MPKKKKVTRRSTPKKVKIHYLWSIFFITLALAMNLYFIGAGMSSLWTLSAVLSAAITLFAVGYERRKGKLGKGKFLWSIFFASLTTGITLYIAAGTNFAIWPVLAVASIAIGLGLLCWEKYNY